MQCDHSCDVALMQLKSIDGFVTINVPIITWNISRIGTLEDPFRLLLKKIEAMCGDNPENDFFRLEPNINITLKIENQLDECTII